jgi:DNA helicase HerA-like ATPase
MLKPKGEDTNMVNTHEKLYIGEGIEIKEISDNNQIIEPLYIDWNNLSGHMAIYGSCRTGKTRLLLSLVRQIILNGFDLIFIDPKGSINQEVVNFILQFAKEANRLNDVKYISEAFPEASIKFNPIYGMNNIEISSLISKLIPEEDPFYVAIAYSITMSSLLGLQFLESVSMSEKHSLRSLITFADLAKYSTQEGMQSILDTINNIDESFSEDINQLKEEAVRALTDQTIKDQIFFKKVSFSLNLILNQLSTGSLGKILCNDKKNQIEDEIKTTGLILIVQPYTYIFKENSKSFMTIFYSMLSSYISNISERKKIYMIIDEASSVIQDINFEKDLFNKAGGLGLNILISSQSIEVYDSEIKDEISDMINDNINTKIYMKMNDLNSRQIVSKWFELGDNSEYSITKMKQKEFLIKINDKKYLGVAKNLADPLDSNDFELLKSIKNKIELKK